MVVVCEDVVVSVPMSGDSGYLIDGPAKCSGSHAVREFSYLQCVVVGCPFLELTLHGQYKTNASISKV
ncbi:hypothetical protein NC653_011848 [Populus alba x Populus x berolinensis]|uniref:Uncharacterized protein n=1 Tax=Populus alba x Populus x berolinensis TaxID=444605 RepID=A0AAD6R3B2_9ROSI|nr:hypothetical protein NC653_011848 [Populus alba x Populus x berolinensis]